jgi:hypothetical protein
MAMRPEEFSRQQIADLFRHARWTELADGASRTRPDPVQAVQFEAWATQHGVSCDDVKSRFGGSP